MRTFGPSAHQTGPSPSQTATGVHAKVWPAETTCALAPGSGSRKFEAMTASASLPRKFITCPGGLGRRPVEVVGIATLTTADRRRPGSPERPLPTVRNPPVGRWALGPEGPSACAASPLPPLV